MAPSGASAIAAPQDLGTKAISARQALATSVSLSSSRNPSRQGETVVFTATVAAAGSNLLPTGTVNFFDNGQLLGSGALNAAGQATFSTSTLSKGSHTITATFVGNASFTTSTSGALTQVVDLVDGGKDGGKDDGKGDGKNDGHHDDGHHEGDWEHDGHEAMHEDHDDEDDKLRHHCKQLRDAEENHGISAHHSKQEWNKLREHCAKFWHDEKDQTILIDKGIRRHIEGFFDHGRGGHHEYWDSKRKKWVPYYKEKVYYPKKKYYKKEKPRPVVRQFAVTG